jgi:Restriction endonuclease
LAKRVFLTGDGSGRREYQKSKSEHLAQPQATPQNEPDKPLPFFLDDHNSNVVARHWVARYSAHRAALLNTMRGSEVFPPLPLVAEAPSLLLQAVILAGGRTNEGTLIEAVALPWFDIIGLLKNDYSIAYQISPEKWEEIIACAYKTAGFEEVTLTPRSGDHGRDIIAIKKRGRVYSCDRSSEGI